MEFNNQNENRSGASGSSKTRSLYERAATDGAWLGLWFTVLFLLSIVSMRIQMLNIVVMAMALLVPFVVFRFLRRTYVDSHGLMTYSALWLQGILTFAAGSLIFCAVSYIFMRWIYPEFIIDTLKMGIDFYSNEPTGAGHELADSFQLLIDQRQVPTSLNIAMSWLWLGLCSGSVVSMLLAALARIAKVPLGGGDPK